MFHTSLYKRFYTLLCKLCQWNCVSSSNAPPYVSLEVRIEVHFVFIYPRDSLFIAQKYLQTVKILYPNHWPLVSQRVILSYCTCVWHLSFDFARAKTISKLLWYHQQYLDDRNIAHRSGFTETQVVSEIFQWLKSNNPI